MKLPNGSHLTYCSNIHPGESWSEVFKVLQHHLPRVRDQLSIVGSFGIGLRLSNEASIELQQEGLGAFKDWLSENGFYVFTMNGFPYGDFHRKRVKDEVHQPDWTTKNRLDYTIRLFDILAEILPEGMDGGISTSPLSYKYWWTPEQRIDVFKESTRNLVSVVKHLHNYHKQKGLLLHLDIEPEPDGLVENSQETITYFKEWLLPMGISELTKSMGIGEVEAKSIILRHIKMCYDVCHFAVAYESHQQVMADLTSEGIGIGKIQISSALKSEFSGLHQKKPQFQQAYQALNEPTYLHQVIAKDKSNRLTQYTDLPMALKHINDPEIVEWRTHFHVPVFVKSYGLLQSTQKDIEEVLQLWKDAPMTNHLEVETYTWEVLPDELQEEIDTSIARELSWVLKQSQ